MIWKIAILDDEEEYLQKIRKLLGQYFIEKNLDFEVYLFQRVDLFIEKLPQLEVCQLFLLDMELPDCTGLQVAQEIRKLYPEPYIIYITNHVEYAPAAFEVNAFRYIPKIILEEKLFHALDYLNDKNAFTLDRAYRIITGSNYENILYRNIYYLYKQGKYVHIVHRFGESKVRKTLQEVYQELDSEEFIFIDKGYIINLIHVMKFEKHQMLMRDQKLLPVSVPRLSSVKMALMQYWEKHNS
ncbi:MAG: LytTR family DNA-binding domain-containing protein [Lachnospiraceae bacterium]|nr:LytTR family DNA-binding domain-containing protein [Lachnospiraceae bacterium]